MVTGHGRLCRADSRNLLKFIGPFERDIVIRCQGHIRFRVNYAFLTGLFADLIDPVKDCLLVCDIFSGQPQQNTAVGSTRYIRIKYRQRSQFLRVPRS